MTDHDNKNTDDETIEALKEKLEQLTIEHREIDNTIAKLTSGPMIDALHLKNLKQKKLTIKDEIHSINQQLLPDIIA